MRYHERDESLSHYETKKMQTYYASENCMNEFSVLYVVRNFHLKCLLQLLNIHENGFLARNTRVSSMNERHWYRQECKVATAVYLCFTLWCIMVHRKWRRDLSLSAHVLSKIYGYNILFSNLDGKDRYLIKILLWYEQGGVLVIDRKLRLVKLP